MALHWSDNVHTTAFTPRDYQVELLAAAVEKNIIICLGHNSSKEFIALKLIQELAYQIRSHKQHKVSLYLTNETTGESAYNLIYHLTDLKVCNVNLDDGDVDWVSTFGTNQVIILSPKRCLEALQVFQLENVNAIIVEDCHKEGENGVVRYIFEHHYRQCKQKPKVLGLAGPLHSAGCLPGQLRPELEVLENSLDCKAETASDIVTVLRYCTKPAELILQCSPLTNDVFVSVLEELVTTRKAYLNDHRYDPSEIYSDDFLEELQAIPDPKKEPNEFLDNYLRILHEMGPWCADRAALHLLAQIEKQKVKTPYERHFLLLCLVSTTFVQIRAFCDYMFQKVASEKERIEKYSSPKVLRLLQALKLFKPEPKKVESGDAEPVPKSTERLESLDIEKIENPTENTIKSFSEQAGNETISKADNKVHLEESVHISDSEKIERTEHIGSFQKVIENECLEQDKELNAIEGCENGIQSENTPERSPHISTKEQENIVQKYNTNLKRPKRKFQPGNRYKGNQYANDPDALCGILFCNDKNTAKILFNLLYEVSRNDPDLGFLKVQYTVDRVADPLKEAKEAEIEHRKQEEVLKRFRMHECNLLVGTSVLEEGIDLPKCNLVIRWDPPSTYRSYVQCKGRARASQAFHMILVGSQLKVREIENETLCDDSHYYVCSKNTTIKTNDQIDESLDSEHSSVADKESLITHKCEVTPSGEIEKLNKDAYDKSLIDMQNATEKMVESLAQYIEIEKMLLRKCANVEPPENEHEEADKYNESIEPYKPLSDAANGASVNLGSAIALINRYCAKLPSDTFTKLTPIWRCAQTIRNNVTLYQYTLRLPINSRLKKDILGIPMPTKVLARRIAALIACRELHRCNELDDALQPIGKEAFRATEPDWENFELEELDEQIVNENLEPRPGTTKRRQYYYKRIASEFSDCRPYAGVSTYLYNIKMTLECPIPEEQNTRGRKIYPPEDAVQGFGIMTLKKIPKVSAFPIFTRSGEVRVSLELSNDSIVLTDEKIRRINHFLNFTFTNVLRLQKYLMLFDPEANENCFFIVPTIKSGEGIEVDWDFLDVIYNNTEKLPKPVDDDLRKSQVFDPNKFKDAVVMPWYRNQDQPQYFYVAEICYHLSPESSFPGENYSTFKEYYFRKYGITIQNAKQPLLDVDHTSARLNFLTPRYVNRKGVALPTSSEETKRAKRENLEQKQILVPELCTIHPFPASLWRAAVCLPCIIYRINALLLADEIRKQVSYDIGLGKMEINNDDFEWPILDFGWSLSEVLRKSREANVSSDINLTNGEGDTSRGEFEARENSDGEKDEGFNDEDKKPIAADDKEGKTANDLLEEADEKLKNENFIEIGTWSNDMADHIMGDDIEASDEEWGLLPPNVNLCSRNNTKIRYGSPTSWDVGAPTNHHNPINSYYSDSDASFQSDDDYDIASIDSNDDHAGPIRIEFKANNVAEAIETEEEILKREKQLAIIQDSNANEKYYQITKNMETGFDCFLRNEQNNEVLQHYERFEQEFLESIENLRKEILTSEMLVKYQMPINLPKQEAKKVESYKYDFSTLCKLVPYMSEDQLRSFYEKKGVTVYGSDGFKITLDDLIELNKLNVGNNSERYTIIGTGDIFDNFSDSWTLVQNNEEKSIFIDYNQKPIELNGFGGDNESQSLVKKDAEPTFSFDYQPDLVGHPGPSPSIILQALTMSNANDGINLERLETIGDSFLKYAITTYLYCTYEDVHEGKLSHLRSKQVSNLNLYRLGRRKVLGECMIATKFEPHDNWLPPCYYVPKELEKALIDAKIPACHWNLADLPNIKELCSEEICELVRKKAQLLGLIEDAEADEPSEAAKRDGIEGADDFPCFIPYNLVTQHSIPDKSVADCVEALIGAYLIECGPRGALLFMAWLGIRVLPIAKLQYDPSAAVIPGSTRPDNDNQIIVYGEWTPPKSPLLVFSPNASESLSLLLDGYSEFEAAIGYYFKDRAYLLQAMTHASYSPNRLSDCYQRLEFLGDAVLDYLITRHLYEDPRQHSPGALTDLRSALVNNTIFASLAVRHGFHKYFRHLSPGLNEVIDRFVRIQHENGHSISEEYYLLSEEECDDAEDVEVPKALGDVFESVAGAIFLDSNMSLDTVWKVYSNMMRPEIEQFSNSVPKSPIRELLELEPETAKFGKPEKLADGRRVRVTVEVFGKGTYRGIGRNYRIAKCTAAKCALRQLKKQGLISKKH